MINKFLEKLNIPKFCELNNTIFKKLFYENTYMSKQDKDIFSNNINKIIWLHSLKSENINIESYKDEECEYEEVEFIQVKLNYESKIVRIAEIIQKTIPYPIVLIFNYENKIMLNVALKKINKVDESKNSVEEFIFTDWIDLNELSKREEDFFNSLNIKELPFSNFYKFYLGIVDKVNLFNASKYKNDFKALEYKNAEEIKNINDKINSLDTEILNLKSKIKKEIHFNRKVEMNIHIKKLEGKKQSLIDKLNS
ncbi:DUF4391 domain-containing protein [Clostridium cochlearium]|uniref:DUF4391 domain-containing protein n=1 Tax=Clostridium cochlearium TaxID=1494 RepID=UPI00156E81C9|nr:DUF4391 domain-containing protein [Clostridium cochlearium]MBV1818129.1 DUF4391 domain-containing protein [Bacteroidales bacterium MSK.15.36]MCG4580082.1 DUF4391 domain-containing protein [Clostridium cochlearium]NSJ90925.1 DUF4391 domain-containing protein [Coprococcus sp. MSK.21.13]